MTKRFELHVLLVLTINCCLILKLISIAWDGNDKGVIAVMLGYPVLIIANGIIWLTLRILKRPESVIYKKTVIGLVILFLPTIIISSLR